MSVQLFFNEISRKGLDPKMPSPLKGGEVTLKKF